MSLYTVLVDQLSNATIFHDMMVQLMMSNVYFVQPNLRHGNGILAHRHVSMNCRWFLLVLDLFAMPLSRIEWWRDRLSNEKSNFKLSTKHRFHIKRNKTYLRWVYCMVVIFCMLLMPLLLRIRCNICKINYKIDETKHEINFIFIHRNSCKNLLEKKNGEKYDESMFASMENVFFIATACSKFMQYL